MPFGELLPKGAAGRLWRQSPPQTVSDGLTLARRAASRALAAGNVGEFGWREALFFGGRIDQWQRYTAVLAAIERECDTSRPLRILDAGAGGPGILGWAETAPWINRATVTTLDVAPATLRGVSGRSVAASGAAMPFRDGAFDLAVSIDSIEHVPPDVQLGYAAELMRVAPLVIAHLPAETADRAFVGRRADRRFQGWYVSRYGREEPNTAEHLATGQHPDPRALFPGAEITGSQPAMRWLRQARDDHSPWRRHLSGFRYRRVHASAPGRGPFHAALVVWRQV